MTLTKFTLFLNVYLEKQLILPPSPSLCLVSLYFPLLSLFSIPHPSPFNLQLMSLPLPLLVTSLSPYSSIPWFPLPSHTSLFPSPSIQ